MGIIGKGLKFLVKFIPMRIKLSVLEEYNVIPFGEISYSQEGEDLILSRLFNNKKQGFFIDIGAYHPIKYSNTYRFYLNGWHGINIDAAPGSMKLFNELRPKDINIESAISNENQLLKYYIFNVPALNTLSEEVADIKKNLPGYFIKEVITLEAKTINEVLEKNYPEGQDIDLLTIDIEGYDLRVLRSLDFSKYKPGIILIEIKGFDIHINDEITEFFRNKGYRFLAKTMNTVFFQQQSLK